jgi:hypothetical protein
VRPRPTILDRTPTPGLYAAGATAATLALGLAALAGGLDLPAEILLIVGLDLLVAALATATMRMPLTGRTEADLTSLLSGAIADGVMAFAISAAAVIAVFGQSKPIERLGYFLAILVLVPLCVTLAWRRQRAGSPGECQRFVAFATLASIAVALCLARALELPSGGAIGTSLFLLVELVAARTAIAFSSRSMPAAWLRRLSAPTALAAAPVLLAVCGAAFIPTPTFSVLDVAFPLAAALAAFFGVRTYRGSRLPRLGGRLADAGILALSSLVLFFLGKPNYEIAENHKYFLGPTLDILHGHPMLVGTFSQYGVGMFYVLAVVFLLVPIGYGTFTLLLSTLTALFFAAFYVILRWSAKSQLTAMIALTAVVVLDMFGQLAFYAYFPSTGVLRFGLPWLLILCSLAAARTTRHKRLFEIAVLAVVAVAAVWSGETGVYCLGTACVLACLNAAVTDGGVRERMRTAVGQVALLIAVSASSVLAFTLVTRLATGVWPHWGVYLEFIHLYTVSDFGDLPILPWSPGLAIGGMYTISAIVIVLLVMSRPDFVRERAVSIRAATGLTALGTIVYTYFLGRSHPNNVIHISPPAIALLFVWFDIARSSFNSRVAMAAASATAVFFGAMIVASQTKNIGLKYRSTALASVLGLSTPLGTQLRTLWDNPVADPSVVHIVKFVKSLKYHGTSLTLVLGVNVESEALLRLGVANAVGSSNPPQEAIAPGAPARIAAEIGSLRPGGVLVITEAEQIPGLELELASELEQRFSFKEIANDGKGLRAFRLNARA